MKKNLGVQAKELVLNISGEMLKQKCNHENRLIQIRHLLTVIEEVTHRNPRQFCPTAGYNLIKEYKPRLLELETGLQRIINKKASTA